jgi:hypothetical protein
MAALMISVSNGYLRERSVAPVKTGEELRMKESYGEGLTPHAGPESCAAGRKAAGEALTGVHVG